MTLLEQARQYVVEDGFSVFPLIPGGKIPFKHWSWKTLQTRQPTDSELVSWFHGRAVNIAIVTGTVSQSLLVLDFDKAGEFERWQALTGLETRTAKTGKGYHAYVRCPDGFNGDMCVDGVFAGQARFDGGYVVAPPSKHPSGLVYHWVNDAPVLSVDLPVLHVAPKQKRLGTQARHRPAVSVTPSRSRPAGVTDSVKYSQAGLDRECETVRCAAEHSRNNTLYTSALKCRKHSDALGEQAVFHALIQAAESAGLPHDEAVKTVLNAWRVARY